MTKYVTVDPEFVDVKKLESMFGIKRTLAYHLMNEKLIKGISLRNGSEARGKRLIEVSSVRNYLNTLMQEQN